MKLYLSSHRFGEKPEALKKLLYGYKQHVGIILNAGDMASHEIRNERLKRVTDRFTKTGLSSEEIDLRAYFGDTKISKVDIDRFGLIWVQGGNVFILRRAYEQSGFGMLIKKLIKDDLIIYGGESAGASILGGTLEGLDIVDDIDEVPLGYDNTPIKQGLSIIDYMIVPHYKSDREESPKIDMLVEFLQEAKLPYKLLRDGEVIVYS